MNNEIKEILNKLQYGFCSELTYEKLLDYITNLQQENQKLNKENEKWFAVAKDFEMEAHDLWNKNNELEQRIEKAVEYIKKHIEKCNIDGYEGKFDNFDIFTKPQKLLNILNGRSDE